MELDLHRLELRFAATRISDLPAVQRLANSIEANGQLVECVAAGEPADVGLVLIDGYRRVAALRRLRRDTALVQCWSCPVGEALAQVLARSGSRAFMPIEEALLLRELIDAHGLTQNMATCGLDAAGARAVTVSIGLPSNRKSEMFSGSTLLNRSASPCLRSSRSSISKRPNTFWPVSVSSSSAIFAPQ
jgi:hypothetical protein